MATKRYRRDFKELELRRRKGMRMLARGIGQAEVARTLEVSRQTTSSWAKKLAEDPQAWRRKPLGRPSGLDAVQKKRWAKRCWRVRSPTTFRPNCGRWREWRS